MLFYLIVLNMLPCFTFVIKVLTQKRDETLKNTYNRFTFNGDYDIYILIILQIILKNVYFLRRHNFSMEAKKGQKNVFSLFSLFTFAVEM